MLHKATLLDDGVKKVILLLIDTFLLIFALWFSFCLRLGEWYWPESSGIFGLFLMGPVLAIPIFIKFGLYRTIIRYIGSRAAWSVVQAVSLYAILWGLFAFLSGVPGVPRSVVLINAMVAFLAIGGSRMVVRWVLRQMQIERNAQSGRARIQVVIFGAGEAGRQLAVGLMQSPEYRLRGFVDDAERLQGRELMGVPILSYEQLAPFVEKNRVTDLLLAAPSMTRKARNHVIERLRTLPLRIRTLPGLSELVSGSARLDDLHDLDIEDLLARESAVPDEGLLQQQVSGKTLMVTGAGGSIGSEICRQVLKRCPSTLILYELSEFALYTIHNELQLLLKAMLSEQEQNMSLVPRVIPLLGAVQDEQRFTEVLQAWRVDVIYHAAARKHVPLSEQNVAETIRNNVFGTLSVAKAAILQRVSNVVLISTDKAVRPTNLMGASKRVAEMALQAMVDESMPRFDVPHSPPVEAPRRTHLSMVRFGNVLGSSGSVVPLFRKQIAAGGPITLTHPDIIRYFMTIPEAAQLVMQAGSMAGEVNAAEVFVLDMGEPVKIYDLAKRMVELSGLRLKDEDMPDGDIEITISGLRPGEKLYEELLIGEHPMPTQHPRIMKAHEEFIPWADLQPSLQTLQIAAENGDVEMIRGVMRRLVSGYQPESEVADCVYVEQQSG